MKQKDVYDPSFFRRLKEVEADHFWFQLRRRWILDKMKKFVPPPARFLEVGCGTGNVSSFLAKKGYWVTGCEFYEEAIKSAWPGFEIVQGDATRLSFADESFDVVGLFDVIEHFSDDAVIVQEATRVLRRGGIIVITVPAREELWSWVDEVSFHKRRYTRGSLEQLFVKTGLDLLLAEYMFLFLYAPMKYSRRKKSKGDLFKIHGFNNMLLKAVFHVERFVSTVVPLPTGTSLIGIARK